MHFIKMVRSYAIRLRYLNRHNHESLQDTESQTLGRMEVSGATGRVDIDRWRRKVLLRWGERDSSEETSTETFGTFV